MQKHNNSFPLFLFSLAILAGCGQKAGEVKTLTNIKMRSAYFKNVQFNVNGYLPQGFNPLDTSIVKKTDCFKITYNQDNSIVAVSFVIKNTIENSYLYGFAERKYDYTDSSIIIANYDKFGKIISQGKSKEGIKLAYKKIAMQNNMPISELMLNINKTPVLDVPLRKFETNKQGQIIWESRVDAYQKVLDMSGGANVYFRKTSYTAKGLLELVSFYKDKQTPISVDEIHATKYTYNTMGNIVENSFLNENMQVEADKQSGMAYRKMEYDKYGCMTSQILLDIFLKPINNIDGYAIQQNKFDGNTNNIERLFFDANNKPSFNKKIGAFGEKYEYTENGDMKTKYFVDNKGNIQNSALNLYAKTSMLYDEAGNLLEESFFDANDKPVVPEDNLAHLKKMEYSSQGLLLKNSYFDINKKPLLLKKCACVSVQFEYDSMGNNTKEIYLNLQNTPTKQGREGIAWRTFKYDIFGENTLTQFFDFNGKEITINGSAPLQ